MNNMMPADLPIADGDERLPGAVTPPMSLSVSELRANLAATLDAVERGERVLVTKHNRIVATIHGVETPMLSPIEVRTAEILAGFMGQEGGRTIPPMVSGSAEYARELEEAVRADRDAGGPARARP